LCVGAALVLLGCADKEMYWTRGISGEPEFQRTSSSCSTKALADVAQEPGSYRGEVNTREGYQRDDPATAPSTENDKRRRERRIRVLYRQCMELRGWVRNSDGKGFKGL
jgi:hypothetical protein